MHNETEDPYVHFRYRDGVNALVGSFRYRYEVVLLSEAEDMARYLARKGYDDFCVRRMDSLEMFHPIEIYVEAR